MSIKELGVPIVLLSASWGVFDVILKTIEIQNRTRDFWRDKSHPERVAVLGSDWFWLWLGTIWFLALFTVAIVMILRFIPSENGPPPAFQKRLCWIAATLPGFTLVGVLIGGILDMKLCPPAERSVCALETEVIECCRGD